MVLFNSLPLGVWYSVEECGPEDWWDCSSEEDLWCLYQPNWCSENISGNHVPAGKIIVKAREDFNTILSGSEDVADSNYSSVQIQRKYLSLLTYETLEESHDAKVICMHTHRHQSYAHTNTPICTHICLLARAVNWGLAYDPINNYAPINVIPHYPLLCKWWGLCGGWLGRWCGGLTKYDIGIWLPQTA